MQNCRVVQRILCATLLPMKGQRCHDDVSGMQFVVDEKESDGLALIPLRSGRVQTPTPHSSHEFSRGEGHCCRNQVRWQRPSIFKEYQHERTAESLSRHDQ